MRNKHCSYWMLSWLILDGIKVRLFLAGFLGICFLSPITTLCQDEEGHYSVTNYSHEENPGHYQNWFITQDQNGFIYSGNGNGVLEFDGVNWRLISAAGLQAVRTVVVDSNNVKWVGADRELGFLAADSLGFLQYTSLKDKIPEAAPLTANIWQIFPDNGRILFVTDNTIYSWENEQFKIIPHPGPIYREYQVNGQVYFKISDKGMYKVVGDELQLINQGEFFKDLRIVVAIPYDKNSVLFASRQNGLFKYDGDAVTKIESDLDVFFDEQSIYAGKQLTDSTYAFATLRGGVIIVDKNGNRLKQITSKEGILNDQVHGLTLDHQNGLWMALQTGISQVEPFAPYSSFDASLGLEGTVSAITRYNGSLYVGTFSGLFVLHPGTGNSPARFSKVEGIENGCFSLLTAENSLLIATANGVFSYRDGRLKQINSLTGARVLYPSPKDKNRIYIGHMHGLSSIYFAKDHWESETGLEQIKEDIFSITSDSNGDLWLGTSLHHVLKLTFPNSQQPSGITDRNKITVSTYADGLPEGSTNLWLIEEDIYVTSQGEGGPLFKLDAKEGRFYPEDSFGRIFNLDSLYVYPRSYQDKAQFLLLETKPIDGKRIRYSAHKEPNGDYKVKRIFDERIRSTTETKLFWDNPNVVWLGGEGISRYEHRETLNYNTPFKTHVRSVEMIQDSVIYGGNLNSAARPILDYSNRSIRFEYAASNLLSPSDTRYQYKLEGFDQHWSGWTSETKKDYTNLPEGDYNFLVKAQNSYGFLSETGQFDFEILAPWHRSWWAYMLYLLAFVGFLYSILLLRSRQLRAKNEALENLVKSRTAEVQHQANQLRIQAEKLQELDKAKSRFFANISHEFRTPLTLIKGPIEHLEQHFDEKLSMENVKMIRRSANRLLNMVNQLLDLSKIDEGDLRLTPTEGDVFKCLRTATSSFSSHAAQRNIDYKVQIPQNVLWAAFDRDKLENIIYNLLGNAFKFSQDDAEISFRASYYENELHLHISDSGKGIPKEKLPFIFDRFYQADSTATKEKEGSGIGLSLSKDLIALMQGSIKVKSELGVGTIFDIRLPLEEIRTGKPQEIQKDDQHKKAVKKPYSLSRTDKRELPVVLLIEDNADMRQFIKERLVAHYRIKEAVNGEAGLKKAIKEAPDLIITDVMMPKLDGIELCKKLKSEINTSHIPIIMLTAKAGIENKIQGLETGADDYLTKPFDAKELYVRVSNLLTQRKKLRDYYSNKELKIDPKKITVTSVDQKFLEQCLLILEENYTDASFSLLHLQELLAMSKTQLHRKLKALTNETPGELIRNFRLKRAAQLLSQKEDSVTQIAYKVGFNNLSYFAKCFKELYGVPPSAYR